MSRRFVIAALVMVSALSGASPATAAVYWGNGWTIGAANLDGHLRQPAYYRPDPETYGQIGAVAVSSDYLYWGGRAGIGRVPLFGPEVPEHIVTTDSPVSGLALDGAHVYWTTTGGEAVGRASLDGSAANPQLVGGLKDARGVAVDSQHLYWTATTEIGRSDLDGLSVERAFRETRLFPAGIAAGGGNLYWGYNGGEAIERAPVAGGPPVQLVRDAGPATALALDAGNVYWARGVAPDSAVGRASLDGSLSAPHWLPGETVGVSGVAVDALPSPPPLPPVSAAVEIVRIKHERRSGAIFVDFSVPATGKLQVVKRRFAWKVLGKPRRQPEVPAGRWRLKLWPGKGAIAAPIRRRLGAKGRAPSSLVISFEEPGKDPSTVAKRIVFTRSRGL
jgi:hypothetical protein